MIAVDTNILNRYAVKDDKRQTALATSFIADNECYVLRVSISCNEVTVIYADPSFVLDKERRTADG
jgi:predicted nucleic-acid-binding protein